MIRHRLFLQWWLFASLLAMALIYLFKLNILHTLWITDFTKLSFLIIGLFLISSIFCGKIAWSLSRYLNHKNYDPILVSKIERDIGASWFISDMFFTIGMVGTVIGFIFMLSGFDGIDFSNPDTTRNMIGNLSFGMSTALYTTLTGLICSIILKVQCFMLEYSLEGQK